MYTPTEHTSLLYIQDPDFEFKEAEVASGETSQGHPLVVMVLGLMGRLQPEPSPSPEPEPET